MENQSLSPQESIRLIERVIGDAKKEFMDNGFFFLLWGWLTFAAALIHYVLMTMQYPHVAPVSWAVLMPLGGIISFIYGMRSGRRSQRRAKTWLDKVMIYTWSAFGCTLFITLMVAPEIGWNRSYPFVMLLYGMGTFISGGVMGFRPLIFGGVASWILAATAFFVTFDLQLLLLAAAILVAYIIPGHWLSNRYKKNV